MVCAFVNDQLDAPVLEALHGYGVRAILLRCAGFNNIDLEAARRLGLFVARVPAYSPEAVAEHTVALILTLKAIHGDAVAGHINVCPTALNVGRRQVRDRLIVHVLRHQRGLAGRR